MKPIREYLDITFRRVLPEMLIENIKAQIGENQGYYLLRLNSRHIGEESFRHYAYLNFHNYSPDEVDNFYYDMKSYMQREHDSLKQSVFHLIPRYMENILVMREDMPCCKYMEMLNWRSASLRLGQNLLILPYMAYEDCKSHRYRDFFAWNSIIGTDDIRLQHILGKGLAENHCHLYGSTQSFPLSWSCMMNHPDKIAEFFKAENAGKRMMENLNGNITLGVLDNQYDWVKRLYIACWIRAELFQRIKMPQYGEKESLFGRLMGFVDFPDVCLLKDCVKSLRYNYGSLFKQPGLYKEACLDYTIEKQQNQWKGYEYNRVLTGERKFLYDCFYNCYSGRFQNDEQDALYLYLLIKTQFRSELIQANQKTGFRNFAAYQDRKSDFWWNVKEYLYESYRLALQAPLLGEPVTSLEVRITPSSTNRGNLEKVQEVDEYLYFANGEKMKSITDIREFGQGQDYFFVIHFPKEKLEYYAKEDKNFFDRPRNFVTRNKTEKWAKAMMSVLLENKYYGERVCGIDACSTEIGCRPETFATEFRFLREIKAEKNEMNLFCGQRTGNKRLWITYHVGEDFLDIADGLRAIDEAVMFLEMERGDRLGHAIALGVEPEVHYALKNNLISMPKQDMLDNYVWILFRSLELGVAVAEDLRSKVQYEAQKLLYAIYPDDGVGTYTLREYYESWKLRGDYPGLYQTGDFLENEDAWERRYENMKKENLEEAGILRWQKKISHLYYRYHFGRAEKRNGQEIVMAEATKAYIDLISNIQECMRKRINEKGIAIECNPTSNVLIGTFKRYDLHPMFHFNSYALKNEDNSNLPEQMNVSINTDDLGVFDTSLENEYALIACALSKKVDENGNKLYSQDAIYDYLEHIRQMGLAQVFRA